MSTMTCMSLRLLQHGFVIRFLHILFNADNARRKTFRMVAQQIEQGTLKIMFPFIPTCQQSPLASPFCRFCLKAKRNKAPSFMC